MIDHKKIIKESLKVIYERYNQNGIESIYLWGSVVSDEYDPETSDVDVIAIVKDDHSIDVSIIREELKGLAPEINKFGFNFVTIAELKNGVSINNQLTNAVPPWQMLADLQYWELIVGKNYSAFDFVDKLPTPKELVAINLERFRRDSWINVTEVNPDHIVYYLKRLTRLVYYLQGVRGIENPFTYKNITDNANDTEMEILRIFNTVKDSKYNRNTFLKSEKTLNKFVNDLLRKY